MYRGLEHHADANPCVADIYPDGVSLNGCSKSLSMPGIRIGWLASQSSPVMERVSELKDYISICPSVVSEVYASIALRNSKTIIRANLKLIKNNMHEVNKFLATFQEFFDYTPPPSGTWCFPRMRSNLLQIVEGSATNFIAQTYRHNKVLNSKQAFPTKLRQ